MPGESFHIGSSVAAQAKHHGVHAKKQIGGTGAPVNYSFDERVFSATDTPADKALAKQQVVASLQSRILSAEALQWNTSTSNYDNMQMTGKCYHRTNVNAERNRTNMYQYNFRAERLPKKWPSVKPMTNRFNTGILEVALKDEYMGETFGDGRMMRGYSKRTEELPNHPDLREKTPWNGSTEAKPPMQTEQFAKFEADRVATSKKWKQTLALTTDTKQYKDPVSLVKEEIERLRQQKIARAEALAEQARRASWYHQKG